MLGTLAIDDFLLGGFLLKPYGGRLAPSFDRSLDRAPSAADARIQSTEGRCESVA